MIPYKILPQQRAAAKKLGVTIRPSTVKGKKIAVYKDRVKVADIGARGYGDYWNYFKNNTPFYAAKKRDAYRSRHDGEQNDIGSPGYYAWYILW